MKKTWQEKFNVNFDPRIEVIEKDFGGMKAGEKMLIPTPALIDAYIKQIPEGKTVDPADMRKDLALNYHASGTCPLTTGIFLRIVAERALEEMKENRKATPFWRVVGVKSPTAKKLSCGIDFIRQKRKEEGID